ncbi:MAG: MFS transporter [Nitriliruptor sp.]
MTERLQFRTTATLGLVAIVGFGVWFYGYGVLLEPIRQDTGWSEAVLSSAYGVSLFGSGALATVTGHLVHQHGSRVVYAVGATIAPVAYLVGASAGRVWVFALAAVVAGSVTGALGYYALIHTVIAQLVPADARAGAITTNTLWGAFASPVFLPLMAWLVLEVGWRGTLRLTGVLVALVFAAAAVLVPDSRGGADRPLPLRAALAAAGRDRTIRRLLTTTFASGIVTSLVILYQVPVMVTGGLTLAVASGLAGARGLLQLGGRIPMPWLIRRVGSRPTLRLAHLLTGVACVLLPLSGALPVAVAFAVVAGFAIGALVPVESIFSAEAVPAASLGVVLGIASLTRGTGAALGPVLGGALSSATGTRTVALVAAGVVALVAAWLVPRLDRGVGAAPVTAAE